MAGFLVAVIFLSVVAARFFTKSFERAYHAPGVLLTKIMVRASGFLRTTITRRHEASIRAVADWEAPAAFPAQQVVDPDQSGEPRSIDRLRSGLLAIAKPFRLYTPWSMLWPGDYQEAETRESPAVLILWITYIFIIMSGIAFVLNTLIFSLV